MAFKKGQLRNTQIPTNALIIAGWFLSSLSFAEGFEAEVGLEGRYFFNEGLFGQEQENVSVRLQPEYDHSFESGDDSVELVLFARWDQHDDERTHGDIREASWTHVGDGWETKVGVSKVFWGVTESQHLVDIINQTDLVESPDGEDKLGQPMASFSIEESWGTLDLFVLPFHRARTFPGEDGRFRTPIVIDGENAQYTSGAGENRVDGAIRYSHYLGDLEFGLSHFSGTSRDPLLTFNGNPLDPKLTPIYTVIDQTGLDAQYIYESWLLKFEGYSRSGYGDRYSTAVTGFEYTQVGIFDSNSDIGWVAEYLFDDRGEAAETFLEQDLFLGIRWTLNDAESSDALFGMFWDPESEEKIVSVEANRRIGQDWKLSIEGRAFLGGEHYDFNPGTPLTSLVVPYPNSKTYFFQDDDFVQIELTRYF